MWTGTATWTPSSQTIALTTACGSTRVAHRAARPVPSATAARVWGLRVKVVRAWAFGRGRRPGRRRRRRLSGNRVWINQGGAQSGTAGTFSDSGQVLGGSAGSAHVKLGDLDGDGDLDAFVANRYGGNRVWINSGGGTFSGNGQSLGSLASRDVSLGDLDADGDLDAFVANLNGGNRVWINQGGAQAARPVSSPATARTWEIPKAVP